MKAIKQFISSISGLLKYNALEDDLKHIVFYSESGQDYHFFENIIKHIVSNNHKICYLTSDSQDPVFEKHNDKVISLYIGDGLARTILFHTLKADLFVLTMIDLNNHHLKRSINRVHYLLVPHTMVSTHMVDHENAYDHYDTICCVGQHQLDEIKKREQLYSLPPKQLLSCGYDRFDVLFDYCFKGNITKSAKTVLVAPSWGDEALLEVCGEELISSLLNNNFRVVLRPHPQTIRLNASMVSGLLEKFSDNNNFIFNPKMSSFDSLLQADIMVSDWSGVAIEFGLALEKPVLYIDVPPKMKNPDYKKLSLEPVEIKFRNMIGRIIPQNKVEQAGEIIEEMILSQDGIDYDLLRKEVVYNIGNSAQVTAQEILKISSQLTK
jgi:CDP-glycerol glycerophosphotransferase (TagB/SpsB family)